MSRVLPLGLPAIMMATALGGVVPKWAKRITDQLECGMSVREIERVSKRSVIPDGRPWSSHFISRGRTDLWLQVGPTGLESYRVVTTGDRNRRLAGVSTPQFDLCTGDVTFLVRFMWSEQWAGSDVFLDGRAVGPADWIGVFLKVSEGRHEIRVQRAREEAITQVLELTQDGEGELTIWIPDEPSD